MSRLKRVIYACPKCGEGTLVGYKMWWVHDAAPGVFMCKNCGHEGERHDFARFAVPQTVNLEGL